MAEVTTVRVLADKALNETCGQTCVDWAVGMLVAGYDGPYLGMLASMMPPHNHFEVAGLRDHALEEVNAPDLSAEDAVLAYVTECLRLALRGELDIIETLRGVKDLYVAHGELRELQDFYLLYFAQDALQDSVVQWYWDGATRENIDSIIRSRVERFVTA